MAQPLQGARPDIADRIHEAQRILLCLGFDGTIVPIHPTPGDVQVSAAVREELHGLAADERTTVAIFSGRQRQELASLVGVPEIIYVGNHGLEIVGPHVLFLEPTAAQFCEPIQDVRTELEQRLKDIPGAIIENKWLSVAVHYRTVPPEHLDKLRQIVHGAMAHATHPFLLREGSMVYEVRPRAYWNKGHALVWLHDRLDEPHVLTIYAGDDPSDEDAFTALPELVSIKVGDAANTAARYVVDGPADIHDFLRWMREQLNPSRTA
jgi:trehalose 6-phosphate phosphatase